MRFSVFQNGGLAGHKPCFSISFLLSLYVVLAFLYSLLAFRCSVDL